MPATSDRLEFAPPPQPGVIRAFALAVFAHLLLMLALTWGVNWQRDAQNIAAEAELWSSVPREAAPQAIPPPPAPAPVPAPPEPVRQMAPPPPTPVPAPDIALEREKKKQALAKQQEELERQKKLEARKKQEELKQQALAEKKAAEDKKKKDEQAKTAKTKQEEADRAKLRQENLARMMKGLETGTGAPSSTGTAARSSGPSASYAAKINASIRPHIRHPQEVAGNPPVVIEVRTSPDGTIVGQRVVKSSGNAAWDESAVRAIVATGSLPRNEEGRVPSPMEISVRHRE